MRAIRLVGINEMKMFDVPTPQIINDTDVLIRMTHVGVCGSDVHYYTQGRIGSQVVAYPFTVGHEGAGIVEKTGSRVTRVKPGDRIAIDPAMPCGTCDQCLAGRHHTCRKLRFLGCPGQAEGCLSEYIVMPEGSCFVLGKNVTQDEGSLSEPLCVGYYGVKLSDVKAGMNIGILGAGPIGMSVLVSARTKNVGHIFMTDKLDYRLALAKKEEASWEGNPDKKDIAAEVKAMQPDMLDIVYECCGKQEAIDQAISLLKPGGKLVVIGIPEVDRYSFSVDEMRRKEICIQNVRRQNGVVEECLGLIENGKIDLKDWVTHRFPLEKTNDAFQLVANYRDGVLKAMIEI
jgi:L-iditol 2-dehydrogenase